MAMTVRASCSGFLAGALTFRQVLTNCSTLVLYAVGLQSHPVYCRPQRLLIAARRIGCDCIAKSATPNITPPRIKPNTMASRMIVVGLGLGRVVCRKTELRSRSGPCSRN
jgi:hypothetical protein